MKDVLAAENLKQNYVELLKSVKLEHNDSVIVSTRFNICLESCIVARPTVVVVDITIRIVVILITKKSNDDDNSSSNVDWALSHATLCFTTSASAW